MTSQSPKTGPAPASPYSALNGARDGPSGATPEAAPANPEIAQLATESERLGSLRQALYASFQAAPMSPVRAPIVDLTMAYTDALRLELKLRASAREQRSAAARTMAKSGLRGV